MNFLPCPWMFQLQARCVQCWPSQHIRKNFVVQSLSLRVLWTSADSRSVVRLISKERVTKVLGVHTNLPSNPHTHKEKLSR